MLQCTRDQNFFRHVSHRECPFCPRPSVICACVSLWRRNRHDRPLLQQCDLCVARPAPRRAVHLDAGDAHIPIRPAAPQRPMAPRPRQRAVLLCRLDFPRHRLARDTHRHDGVQPVGKECLRTLFLWAGRPEACFASTRNSRGVVREIFERRRENYL